DTHAILPLMCDHDDDRKSGPMPCPGVPASIRAFTPIFDRLWTRMNAPAIHVFGRHLRKQDVDSGIKLGMIGANRKSLQHQRPFSTAPKGNARDFAGVSLCFMRPVWAPLREAGWEGVICHDARCSRWASSRRACAQNSLQTSLSPAVRASTPCSVMRKGSLQ